MILIIGLVTVAAISGGALSAYNHREVSEAARMLQGALVGARDKAIHDGQPCGIRLLPDPTYPITWLTVNNVPTSINPYSILAYNRIVPIDSAPEYSEGAVSAFPTANFTSLPNALYTNAVTNGLPVLILEEALLDQHGFPNPPTSWAWNVRVGDKIQLNNAGAWYTVVGPMGVQPNEGNTELFVNYGVPQRMPLVRNGTRPEFLWLVNGRDDNLNGWVDEGWDGVDNDGDGFPDQQNNINEWEQETWQGIPSAGVFSVPYTLRRRPAPAPGAREVSLPTSMVIDGTGMFLDRERSRFPANNPLTLLSGYVDIVLNPDGTVVPTTTFSAPSSFGMDQAFYHFWLAERQDLAAVQAGANGPLPLTAGAPYFLPIAQPGNAAAASQLPGPYLKGAYSVLTLFARTGQISVNASPPFLYDPSLGYNNQSGSYHPYNPFIPAEIGVSGGP